MGDSALSRRNDRSEAPKVLLHGFPGTSSRGFLGWSSVVLVRRSGRVLLFDTGSPGDRVGLLAALAAEALAPEAVDGIVLSHLHFDHALNVELFPNADICLHRTELAYAQDPALDDLAICAWATDAIARHPRLKLLDGEPELIEGIRVLHTPGHTAGCISLAMTVAGEAWILAQDAVKHRKELALGDVEMAADRSDARTSLERIRRLARVVVPGHDVPLRLEGDRVVPLAEAHAVVTEVLSGRTFSMKAGSTNAGSPHA